MSVLTETVNTVDTVALPSPVEPVLIAATVIARMRNGEMPLFLTAHEIMQAFQPFEGDREGWWAESDDVFWERKYDEMCGPDFNDILENGVRNPISLQWHPSVVGFSGLPEILGGHHRTAVMHVQKPHALMPVAFFEDIYDAQDRLGEDY